MPLVIALGNNMDASNVKNIISRFGLIEDADYQPTYYENKNTGIAVNFECAKVAAIFLFSEGKDGFSQYKGKLVNDLTFDSGEDDVLSLMGKPSMTGAPQHGSLSVIHGGWIRYDYPDFSIHFSFTVGVKKIELVTLMPRCLESE